ncbi:sugar porter family MFS transporter [Legionella worsleiensis]|uniref:Sugar-proton symporter n=1 Tax=Legionella worsleiensis TaxID=45076 RepID=A0A0W1A6J9_9GAMM|nr:sugar porter family MFS transporter [Legionella worsleiensis]KTD76973.1 sugar-proton symporter [Legionella worsleiensis]STY33355.1 sugar-proton symporter [Legionella worsleiensis]
MHKGVNSLVFVIALIAGFAGFLLGFDSSLLANVKDQVVEQLSLSQLQWSWVVSISLIGCMLSIPLSGFIADKISRRSLLQMVASGFIVGAAICAFTHHVYLLLWGRFIMGFCVGIASYIAPLFISEMAPPQQRGTLVLFNGLAITFGQAIAYLTGFLLHDYSATSWRCLFWIGSLPAIVLFLGMSGLPHSPAWILKQKGRDETLKILRRIRPQGYNVEQELEEMNTHKAFDKPNLLSLFKMPVVAVLLVGICLGIFQQFAGINALKYYGPVIFESAGFLPVKNAILATCCIGTINCIFTLITLLSVDRLGRRPLLLCGTLIASLSLFAVSYVLHAHFEGQKYWVLGFLSIYVMGYCISVGSLFWVLIAEIYPFKVRAMAMSIATVTQFAANFVVSISFLSVYQSFGQVFTFSMFGSFCLLACAFIYYFVPETTGVSLEHIEDRLLSGKKIRDIGQPVSDKRKIKKFELLMD